MLIQLTIDVDGKRGGDGVPAVPEHLHALVLARVLQPAVGHLQGRVARAVVLAGRVLAPRKDEAALGVPPPHRGHVGGPHALDEGRLVHLDRRLKDLGRVHVGILRVLLPERLLSHRRLGGGGRGGRGGEAGLAELLEAAPDPGSGLGRVRGGPGEEIEDVGGDPALVGGVGVGLVLGDVVAAGVGVEDGDEVSAVDGELVVGDGAVVDEDLDNGAVGDGVGGALNVFLFL